MNSDVESTSKLRRRLWIAGAITGGVFLVVFIVFLEVSSHPKFCRSCHFMEAYYDSWALSTHNDIPCGKCHYPPGFKGFVVGKYKAIAEVAMYITGRYHDEPRTEVPDENCLMHGCHDTRFVDDESEFRGVPFSHDKHLRHEVRGKHLRCTSCHSQIVQGAHMTVTETTCFLCHFKDTQRYEPISGCPSCHEAPLGKVEFQGVTVDHKDMLDKGADCRMCHLSVIDGNGEVLKDRCYTCHDKPERLAQFPDSDFLHEEHVTGHKIDCINCHGTIRHEKKEITQSISIECQQCHPDHHAAQRELYMGVGGKNVASQPDAMFLARVSCNGCHIAHQGDDVIGFTEKATAKSCAVCHDENYSHMQTQWDQGIARLLQQIEPSVTLVDAELTRLGTQVPGQARELYQGAAHNVEFVSYGKGVHNIQYSQHLLLQAHADLVEALRLAQSPQELQALQQVQQGSQCQSCHFGIETKAVEIDGQRFEHSRHLLDAKLDCDVCHSDAPKGQEGHGQTPITVDQCMDCHHNQTEGTCSLCHGTLPVAQTYRHSVFDHQTHAEARGEACETCHQKGVQQTFQQDCVQCHHDESSVDVEQKCQTCHSVQTAMFAGQGYQRPSIKSELEIECIDCHMAETPSVGRATRNGCADCHEGEGDYAGIMDATQAQIRDQLSQVETSVRKIRSLKDAVGTEQADDILTAIEQDVTFVKQDRSRGIHNPELADELLQKAQQKLDLLLNEMVERIQE